LFADGILPLMSPHSIYIHIPFCQKRCSYCDFNTYAGRAALIPRYVAALENEIRFLASGVGEAIQVPTIFFGGGTPSLLPPPKLERIITTLQTAFHFQNPIEITLEANPGTLSLDYLQTIREIGINRLSFGMQSAQPKELALLERQHDHKDVVKAVTWARQASFDNLSLDLIFGLPRQTLNDWSATLTQALDLSPDHFSLYALTIEPDTPLHTWADQGLIPIPDPDLAAEMYELASEKLAAAGYLQYEISNWARTNNEWRMASGERRVGNGENSSNPQESTIYNSAFECRHNLQYWRNQPYLGLGAGSHGFSGGYRTANVRSPEAYIHALKELDPTRREIFPRTPSTAKLISIDREMEMQETMMMGLRLTYEGVSEARFKHRFEASILQIFGTEVNKLIAWGLIEWAGDRLRLTSNGRLLGNQVFMEFV